MTDYSEAELVVLEEVFPTTTVYLCDFHREQAWERWVKDHKHGLSQSDAECYSHFSVVVPGPLLLMVMMRLVHTNHQ